MSAAAPTLAELKASNACFLGLTSDPDRSWHQLLDRTRPALDLSLKDHRTALLTWLNSWGCRIRYPRPGEPDHYDANIATWWTDWSKTLPEHSLAELPDSEAIAAGDAYAALASTVVSMGRTTRTLGPTAAAKALHALCPDSLMPWDAAIAARLHGRRDAAAFAGHQILGRTWAQSLITATGTPEQALPAMIGRPGVSLARVLDEYCWVTYTFTHGSVGEDP